MSYLTDATILNSRVRGSKDWRCLRSFQHPKRSPWNRNLSTDVFYAGPKNDRGEPTANHVIMVMSGTHGVEGPAGSRFQEHLVKSGYQDNLPPNTGLMLVHALNPWGYAHLRRVDHKNVDVNRGAGPDFRTICNYRQYQPLFEPKVWDAGAKQSLLEALKLPGAFQNLKDAASGGQFDFSEGLFYGGKELCWSAQTIYELCKMLAHVQFLAVLDVHTGLGKNEEAAQISSAGPEDQALINRLRTALGPVEFPNIPDVGSVSSPIRGDILSAIVRWLPNTKVAPVAVEIGGPIAAQELLLRLVAENCITHNPTSIHGLSLSQARSQLAEAFNPNTDSWNRAALDACLRTYEGLLRYLQAESALTTR